MSVSFAVISLNFTGLLRFLPILTINIPHLEPGLFIGTLVSNAFEDFFLSVSLRSTSAIMAGN